MGEDRSWRLTVTLEVGGRAPLVASYRLRGSGTGAQVCDVGIENDLVAGPPDGGMKTWLSTGHVLLTARAFGVVEEVEHGD